jgi:hypothetical protein
MRPEARRERLLFEDLGEEVVLYDVQRHRAHQLNRTAALVWRNCNGRRTVAELRKILQTELDPAIDEVIVWQALDQLGKAHLLREPGRRPGGATAMTRRQALGRLGRTAALALLAPVVTSVTASPLLAGSQFLCDEAPCINACAPLCTSDADCPSGNPACRLLACNNPNCPCSQMRCTKAQTPTAPHP